MRTTTDRTLEARIRGALHSAVDDYVPSPSLASRAGERARVRARQRTVGRVISVAAAVVCATFTVLVLRADVPSPARLTTVPSSPRPLTQPSLVPSIPPSSLGTTPTTWPGGPSPTTAPVPQPPPLPAPGRQPVDPAGARAAVGAAFATTFQPNSPPAVRATAVERGAVLIPLFQQALQKQGDIVSGTSAIVDAIVFTDPAHAAVRYELVVPSIGSFPYDGSAVHVDGGWKVSHATACDALGLALGAVTCPP